MIVTNSALRASGWLSVIQFLARPRIIIVKYYVKINGKQKGYDNYWRCFLECTVISFGITSQQSALLSSQYDGS